MPSKSGLASHSFHSARVVLIIPARADLLPRVDSVRVELIAAQTLRSGQRVDTRRTREGRPSFPRFRPDGIAFATMAGPDDARPLNRKQRRFIAEYLLDLNGTQAAIRAGYSPRTANEQAAEMLAQPRFRAAVDAAIAEREKRTAIKQDYVLRTIHETVERCRQAAPVLDKMGRAVLVETPSGDRVPAYVFDAREVLKGCELLGRHLGMFPTKVEHSGTIGLRDARELSDEELSVIAAGGALPAPEAMN